MCCPFYQRDILDKIWDVIKSVSEGFLPTLSTRINCKSRRKIFRNWLNSIPDLIQDISWEKDSIKKTPSKIVVLVVLGLAAL